MYQPKQNVSLSTRHVRFSRHLAEESNFLYQGFLKICPFVFSRSFSLLPFAPVEERKGCVNNTVYKTIKKPRATPPFRISRHHSILWANFEHLVTARTLPLDGEKKWRKECKKTHVLIFFCRNYNFWTLLDNQTLPNNSKQVEVCVKIYYLAKAVEKKVETTISIIFKSLGE